MAVTIAHTFRGDLLIELVAPDGTAYRLKAASPFDSADNVNSTYTVNLSGESANGAWKLRANDLFDGDTGYINTWTLTLYESVSTGKARERRSRSVAGGGGVAFHIPSFCAKSRVR